MTIDPLIEMRNLRTKFCGHRTGSEAVKIRNDLIKKHGSLKEHFRSLLQRTDQVIQTLLTIQF